MFNICENLDVIFFWCDMKIEEGVEVFWLCFLAVGNCFDFTKFV